MTTDTLCPLHGVEMTDDHATCGPDETKAPARAPRGLAAYWWAHRNTGLTEKARGFLGELTLDNGKKIKECLPKWEQDAYESILGLPGCVSGEKDMLEVCGPVGCGKDQILAAAFLACLHFGPKGFVGLKQSVTKDKSKAVVKCIRDFCFRDPKVGAGIVIQRDLIQCDPCDCETDAAKKCHHRNSLVTCGALDGPSTAGVIYDLAILNEVQEWPTPEGEDVYTHILARRTKRKGRLACMTNAPRSGKGEWRRDRWEVAKSGGPDWWYFQVAVTDCPWITPEDLEAQRRNLPTAKFKRLFLCEASDGAGELVTREEVQRAIDNTLAPAQDWSRHGRRFLGLDMGIRRDHYALALLCLTPSGAVFLEQMECFVPKEGAEVDLAAAAVVVRHYCKAWGATLFADPYQAKQLLQELEAEGCDVETVDPVPTNTTGMAHAVMDLFRDNRVRIFPNAGFKQIDDSFSTSLEQQLVDAEIKEGDRGIRISSKRTRAGHGDQASAFALAALGVARAGAFSQPVTVGSASIQKDQLAAARERLDHRHRPHAGRYLGARVPHFRRVAR